MSTPTTAPASQTRLLDTTPGAAISLPLDDAIEAASAVLPHIATDDNAPILTNALLTATGDQIELTGTDRYTVGRFTIDAATGATPRAILLPRAAVEWIAKTTRKQLRRAGTPAQLRGIDHPDVDPRSEEYAHTVDIEHTPDGATTRPTSGTVTVAIRHTKSGTIEKSQAFDHVDAHNFPPVARLFPDEPHSIPAEIGLTPVHLTKVLSYAAKWHKDHPVTFASTPTADHRLAPVIATIGRLTALIQPNRLH